MTTLKQLPQLVQVQTPSKTFNFRRGKQTVGIGSPGTLAYKNEGAEFPHITISGNEDEHFRNFHITDEIKGKEVRVYYSVKFSKQGNPTVNYVKKIGDVEPSNYGRIAVKFVARIHQILNPLTEKESEIEENQLIWQGLTLDEHILQLPGLVLDRNIPHFLKQPSFKKLVKSQYKGNLKEAITRSITHLAKYAIYTGNKVYPGLNRKLRVFETQDAYGTNYQIYTWPLSSTQSLILTLQQTQPMSGEADFLEGEINKETGLLEIEQILDDAAGRVTTSLNEAPAAIRNKGWQRGIYVIFRDGKRVDLGKSQNLPKRLNDHLYSLKRKKLETKNYKAIVFHYPNANDKTLLAREREYRRRFPNVFSHLNDTEMEDLEDLAASVW